MSHIELSAENLSLQVFGLSLEFFQPLGIDIDRCD